MCAAQIVLIEDNDADVFLVELALKEQGIAYNLTRFACGADAVAALCHPTGAMAVNPDAILLDLNTPRSDGFEVLQKLRSSTRLNDVPIAILSSSQARSDFSRTQQLGAVRYIEKPTQLNDFLARVGQGVTEMLGLDFVRTRN